MVDEVQDVPPAFIQLLSKITTGSLSFGGDTAQTISQGSNFKFQMLKSIRRIERVIDLPTNYRSTA